MLARNSAVPNETIEPVLQQYLSHSDTSVDLALTCCRHLNDNGRLVLCERAVESLLTKYANLPQASRVYAKRFEYNVKRLENAEALEYTRDFLQDAKMIQAMDEQSRTCVQMIMWEKADKYEENGDCDQTLAWYDRSVQFYRLCRDGSGDNADVVSNIAKLLRNRVACLLLRGQLEEANRSANEASEIEPDNPRTDFALFNVALHRGDERTAIAKIDRLANRFNESMDVDGDSMTKYADSTIHGLVCLCAQVAFERPGYSVAEKALYHVHKTTNNRTAKLIALRCLIRLILKKAHESTSPHEDAAAKEMKYILEDACLSAEEALKVLQDVSSCPLNNAEVESRRATALSSQTDIVECTDELIQDEAEWFMKICWNMAVEGKTYTHLMKRLFHLSFQQDSAILTRQKTCLLLTSAAALEVARNSNCKKDMETNLLFALEQIDRHKSICGRLRGNGLTSLQEEKESVLRSLYELEARIKLSPKEVCNDSTEKKSRDIEGLFEAIVSMRQSTVSTYETVAALCIEPPANYYRLSTRVLKLAIAKLDDQLKAGGDRDVTESACRFSTFYRTLIEMSLKGDGGVNTVNEDESLSYFLEILCQLEGKLKNACPEQEILWFMVKSWNIGARLYVGGCIVKAEKWFSTAMRFLVHLKMYKAGYEDQMNEIYMEVLAKKDGVDRNSRRMEIS